MSLLGIEIALGSLAVLAMMALTLPFLVWRIGIEEGMLVAEFGEEYAAYRRRTV